MFVKSKTIIPENIDAIKTTFEMPEDLLNDFIENNKTPKKLRETGYDVKFGVEIGEITKGTNWFYTLGSATLFAFLSQAVTGVVLAMYYSPSATGAYESTRHITNDVFLGEFVRGMHKWGSSVMVILIFLHMGRTFFFGAYKYPRELNWIIGVVLVVLTFVMALTGYLLPFDQRSYWATIVAGNINGTGPIVGPFLTDALMGGGDFGATTLSRFYSIHMLVIPGAIAAMIGATCSRHQARHHRAAVAEGRAGREAGRGARLR